MNQPEPIRCNVGIVGTTCHQMFRVPSGFGGITVTKAYLDPGIAAATVGLTYIVDGGPALGTARATSGTLGTIAAANGTFVADTPKAFSLVSAPYLAEGHWMSLYVATGVTIASSAVVIEYKVGK